MIDIFIKYWPVFLQGTLVTLLFAFLTVIFGTLLGGILALLKKSKYKIIRFVASSYIEILRGTPLLLQLYFFYFLLPDVIGLDIPKEICILIALIVNSSAYVAEIIRAGIQGVDKGQFEAAKSLGMSNINMMVKIILPQAIKNILPALGNEFVSVIKETSLASTFYVGDLMTKTNIVKSATFMPIESLMIAGVIYFILTFSLTKAMNYFERRLKQSD